VTVIEKPAAPSAPQGDSDRSRNIGSLIFFGMAGLLIALVAALLVIGVIGLLTDDGGSGAGGGSASSTVDVSLTEFAINGNLTVPPGDVTLNVTNNGSMQHDLVVESLGAATPMLNGGGTSTLALGNVAAGEYRIFCSVPGHAESGMEATLVVSSDATAGGTADGHGGDGHGADGVWDAEKMDQKMIDSMLAFPAETEGKGNQVLEPKILADGTKEFELTAEITPWEVSPGEFVDAWSYNGMVPGPVIKTEVGDNVRVIFNNLTPLGSDIHWHGLPLPNTQDGVAPYTQEVVRTGETFIYEFVTDVPMIAMYHAHMHAQIAVPNGMFGAFLVGDNPIPYGQTISGITIPEDLVVAEEIPMVLNDAGVIGLTLNGKSFPATEPMVLQKDEWASVHYYNEGLMPHPMHLHGFPQLVYAKDGIPLDQPYWADTINVAPGERYSVLFQGTIPGVWVWHCHILTHVESAEGLFGMATAVIVQE
jgi:manganese oxidase